MAENENGKTNKDKVQEMIKEALDRQYKLGITVGMGAASNSILKTLNDSSKSIADRIEDVKKFCSVSIDNVNKELSKAKK